MRAGLTPKSDPKDVQAAHFAGLLGERIERARIEHGFDRLVLVAPPRFLGLLGQSLGAEATRLVGRRIDKDYTHLPLGELRDLIAE
jgi:protein required for attachment to host cells